MSALLSLAMLVPTACTTPPRVPAAPDTISSLAREPRIVAVHYHDLGTRYTLRNDMLAPVNLGAPLTLIKDRFLRSLQSRLGLLQIRNVPEPRFAYFERGVPPPGVGQLKRTFERGLVFDFSSPWARVPAGGGRLDRDLTVQARLVRLDDLTVLWADTCSFAAGTFPNPVRYSRIDSVEQLYEPAALERAADCADALVARLLGTDR